LRLCHGDLHAKNMFDDGARIHFIDFDAALMAPPEHDAASLSAALMYFGALEGYDDCAAADAFARWRSAYELAGGRLNEERLAWLSVYCLLDERLYRCLTRLKPGRREVAESLVAQAERITQHRSARDV
jgi:thiamine kinase-like enzyme